MGANHPSPLSASQEALAPSNDDAILRSMNAVRSIVRALRVNTRAIEVQTGISLAQLFVLQQLAERPAHSLNDLAARTATHQSSVSVVVRRLVERGLATRVTAPTDKRRIEITVTESGREMLAGAPTTIQAQLVRGLGALSAAERQGLADLIERWLAGASINITTPPMLGEDDILGVAHS